MKAFWRVIVGLSLILTGCVRMTDEPSQVNLKLPSKNVSSKVSKKSFSTSSQWGLEPGSQIGEFDCYIITASGPGMSGGSCQNTDSSYRFAASQIYGMFPQGQTVSIDVPSGSQRTFSVLGVKSSDGQCPGALSSLMQPENFSTPLMLGQATINLDRPVVDLLIPVQVDQSRIIETCSGERYGQWPSCHPNLAQAKYLGGGEFALAGTCLDQIQTLKLENSSAGTSEVLQVLSKTASSAKVKLAGSLSVKTSQIYRVLVQSAKATSSITVNFESAYGLELNGSIVGDWFEGWVAGGKVSAMNGMIYISNQGTPFRFRFDSSQGIPYELISVISVVDTAYDSSFTLFDLKKMGVYATSSNIYFADPDCSGDPVVPGEPSQNVRLNSSLVIPKTCNSTSPISCASIEHYLYTGSHNRVTNFDYQSYTTDNYMEAGKKYYCYNGSGTLSNGIRMPIAGLQTFIPGSPGFPPSSISTIAIKKK